MENTLDYEKVVKAYIDLKDLIESREKRLKDELAPLKDKLAMVESLLSGELNRLNLKNLSTPHGTVFRKAYTNLKVTDWTTVIDFIKQNDRYDLLEKRLTKSVAMDTMEETPIPGVSVEQGYNVSIRRK